MARRDPRLKHRLFPIDELPPGQMRTVEVSGLSIVVVRKPDGTLVQTRAELGTPLSSGCIRQWVRDAQALYAFAAVDTPVEVTA